MNIKIKKTTNRFLVLLFTLLFAVSAFTVAAFASPTSGSSSSDPVSSVTEQLGNDPNPQPTNTGSSSQAPNTPVSSSDGTGGVDVPGSESTVSSKPSLNSSRLPNSSSNESNTSKTTSSRRAVSQQEVDTQKTRVEALASAAEQAVSDPDVLSSQDWSDLLSSGSSGSQSSSASSEASGVSSVPQSQGGGISWLLILGIVLVVLSLCGIGFFVYAQFLSDSDDPYQGPKGPAAPRNPGAGSTGKKQTEDKISDTMDFTDISSSGAAIPDTEEPSGFEDIMSNSSDAAKLPKPGAQAPKAAAKSDVVTPAPKEELPPRTPQEPQQQEASPKAQATPVESGKNFDWEEFFNEDKK